MPAALRDYVGIASRYVDDVISGAKPACKWVRLACERQRRDLESGVPGFRFSVPHAARVCCFVEMLRHVKGELSGKRIRLESWQIFILTTVFGWVDAAGRRRFRRVYIEVPRGNGKSAISSGIALYGLCADHESGAEVYSLATTREQAKLVFETAQEMVRKSPDVAKYFGISVQAKSISVTRSFSRFEAKSSEGSTLDGLNTHVAVIDELHAHKTRDVYDVVETSIGKRVQPLLWVITTAGFNTSGICYEVRTVVTRVLQKALADETQFGIIYSIDEGDDWTSVRSLIKANPNWGISVMPNTVLPLLEKAQAVPSAANNFKTKHLDIWCEASSAWMDMTAWARCKRSISLDDFAGQSCFIGLDLAAKNDLTAKVYVFPVDVDGKTSYAIFTQLWLPEKAVKASGNSQYSGWTSTGLITETPGAMTDLNMVEESIRDDMSRFQVMGVAYDPWQATQLAETLAADGAPMIEFRMTVQNLSEPMKRVEALVLDGRIQHDGNEAMTWMMSNVVARLDAKDNIFPRKERYENKIDGPVAFILALGCAGTYEPEKPFDLDAFLAL